MWKKFRRSSSIIFVLNFFFQFWLHVIRYIQIITIFLRQKSEKKSKNGVKWLTHTHTKQNSVCIISLIACSTVCGMFLLTNGMECSFQTEKNNKRWKQKKTEYGPHMAQSLSFIICNANQKIKISTIFVLFKKHVSCFTLFSTLYFNAVSAT